ncbi:BPTI/Kunitz domain-containing protein-like, partial [Pseudonaja textilis]|uniref:BPTI/Kunitz domain-containing protein-like n=1 Tax=Pseudonaja textilis TaxID=8673 RepID=UPI000EAA5532
MGSGRSPLPLLLGVAFALWSPLLSRRGSSKPDCSSFPTYFERCRLPKEHFFYNQTAKRCQLFLDFGCPGSLNTYDTLRKCQQSCSEIDICTLPPDRGPCNEKLHRWFYEPKTGKCTKFIFGGCEGNANNFN